MMPQKRKRHDAHKDELYPSKWLKATDLDGATLATIDHCEVEPVGQGAKAERKLVLYFRGALKPLICNKTNFGAVVRILNRDDSDDWGGGRIELFVLPNVTFSDGGIYSVVRIRAPRRQARSRPRPAPQSEPDPQLEADLEEAMPTFDADAALDELENDPPAEHA